MNWSTQEQFTQFYDEEAQVFIDLQMEAEDGIRAQSTHRLRIATRRLRVALWLLKDDFNGLKKHSKRLKKIGHRLGAARELDVAIKDSTAYGIDEKKLRKKRKKARRRVEKGLRSKKTRNLMKGLLRIEDRILASQDLHLEDALDALYLKLSPQLHHPLESKEDFHQFRIALKKLRYAFEALGQPVEPMKVVQDMLGQAHDLEVLWQLSGSKRAHQDEAKMLEAVRVPIARLLQSISRETLVTSEHSLLQ